MIIILFDHDQHATINGFINFVSLARKYPGVGPDRKDGRRDIEKILQGHQVLFMNINGLVCWAKPEPR